MISSSFNWSRGQADLLRRAAKCAPLWGAWSKTAFYERGLFTYRPSPSGIPWRSLEYPVRRVGDEG